jgi:hypothetical protein
VRALLLAGAVTLATALTPDSPQHIAAAVHDWLSHILGSTAPDLPVHAEAQGDHYRLTIPLIGLRTAGESPELSADMQQQPDGTWRLERVSIPARFALPAADGETHVSIGRQAITGSIDPSLHVPSTLHAEAADVRTTSTQAPQQAEQQIGQAALDVTLTPAENGNLDLIERNHFENWQSGLLGPNGIAVGTGVRSGQAELTLNAVAPDHVAPAIRALIDLIVATRERNSSELSPQSRAAMRQLVQALDGLARSARLDESLQGLQIELAGIGRAAIDHAHLGFGEESTGGLLRAWVDLALDGLTIGGLPNGLSAFVPTRISLRPSVKGVPADALRHLLLAGTEQPGLATRRAYSSGLLARGSTTIGIDAFSFKIGPAEFSGAGVISFPSAATTEAEARVTATGFDTLMEQTTQNPSLNQIAPVLALVRGLAKQDGNHLVWAIHAGQDDHITVNGMDLSTLLHPAK